MFRGSRAGNFDRRIIIEQKSETADTTYGGSTFSWATYKTRWAAIKPYSRGIEYFDGGAVRSEKTLIFSIRYTTGITTSMRILHEGKYYNIRATQEPATMRKTVLEIYAEAEE